MEIGGWDKGERVFLLLSLSVSGSITLSVSSMKTNQLQSGLLKPM